jgi:hypothetical protein
MKATDLKGTKSNRIVESGGRLLPKNLYAKYLWSEADDPWLEANEEIEELAEKGETTFIGEYKLVKVHKAKLDLRTS